MAQLVTRLNIGGVGQQVLLLTRLLSAKCPTMLLAGTPSSSEGELRSPGIAVHPVPLVRDVRPARDLHALAVIRRLLIETGTTVLHTHTTKAGLVGRLAALCMYPRPRLIHTFHGHLFSGYFGRVYERILIDVERALALRTDVLIAVSPEVRDSLLDRGIGRPDQIRVIPYAVDSLASTVGFPGRLRRHLGLPLGLPLIGVVARLVPIKDHGTLLAAMLQVPEAHLVVLGDGLLRDGLESLTRHLRLGTRVHFVGWWDDIPGALYDIDIVVLTSKNEGLPVALMEAATCGRPVVATAVGGVAQVVEHGVTGYLAPPGHSGEIAKHINRLIADPPLRRRMGAAARAHAMRFSEDRLLTDTVAAYYANSPAKTA